MRDQPRIAHHPLHGSSSCQLQVPWTSGIPVFPLVLPPDFLPISTYPFLISDPDPNPLPSPLNPILSHLPSSYLQPGL